MASADSSKEVPKKVVRQAINMALGTFSSRVLGLLRDMALAALFSRTVTDAWTAAFRLPNLFRRLLGEGSLSVSFIPVFVEARLESPERARNLANGLYTLLLVFLAVLTALGILFAEPILHLILAADYSGERFELTLRMARIMFGFIFFVSSYAYFMGILNALGRFALPALAPTLFNVAMILSTLIPGRYFPQEGDGLAWGVLLGGALQAGILVPALRRLGAMPQWSWQWQNSDIIKVLKNMLPGFVGTGLLQFTTIVNLKFASGLGQGSISYIYWADRLLEFPLSLVAVSLGAALLPTLATFWSQGRKKQMSETANYYLRLNLFLAIPAGLGLYFLARPLVEVLFMRGRFNASDAEATAAVLQVYSMLVISASCVRVMVPSYYAIKNTWFPAVVAAIALVTHILLAPVFMREWGLPGLVTSSLISASLNILLLLIFYPRFIGAFDYLKLLQQLCKFLIAGVALVVAVQVYHPVITIAGDSFFAKAFALGVSILFGGAAYLLTSVWLKTEEVRALQKSFIK